MDVDRSRVSADVRELRSEIRHDAARVRGLELRAGRAEDRCAQLQVEDCDAPAGSAGGGRSSKAHHYLRRTVAGHDLLQCSRQGVAGGQAEAGGISRPVMDLNREARFAASARFAVQVVNYGTCETPNHLLMMFRRK